MHTQTEKVRSGRLITSSGGAVGALNGLHDPGSQLKTWYRIRRWKMRFPDIGEPGLACKSDLAMVLTSNGWAMRGGRFE